MSLFGAHKRLIHKMPLACLSLPEIQNHRSILIFRSHWVFFHERETGAQTWGGTGTGQCLGGRWVAPVTAVLSSRMGQDFLCPGIHSFLHFQYDDHFTKLLV